MQKNVTKKKLTKTKNKKRERNAESGVENDRYDRDHLFSIREIRAARGNRTVAEKEGEGG